MPTKTMPTKKPRKKPGLPNPRKKAFPTHTTNSPPGKKRKGY